MKIATHDGSFHADETLACAIITHLHPDAEIIRSRDPQLLETADIIIDVSGINDEKHFDHHSNEFNLTRPNGINYATAGLMWVKFARPFLEKVAVDNMTAKLRTELTDEVYKATEERIDREIMYMVDLNDNGQLNSYIKEQFPTENKEALEMMDNLNEFYLMSPDISYLVAKQNVPNATNSEQNKNFEITVSFLRQMLVNAALNALYIELGISKVLSLYDGGELLILKEKLPWTHAVQAHFDTFKNCKLAIYPDRKRGWRIQSLPYSKSERFRNRLNAPKAWRGLDEAELDKATGLTGTIFVHRGGFTGGAMEFETNLEMAKLWLRDGEPG